MCILVSFTALIPSTFYSVQGAVDNQYLNEWMVCDLMKGFGHGEESTWINRPVLRQINFGKNASGKSII